MLHLLPACLNFERLIFQKQPQITQNRVVLGFFNVLFDTYLAIHVHVQSLL